MLDLNQFLNKHPGKNHLHMLMKLGFVEYKDGMHIITAIKASDIVFTDFITGPMRFENCEFDRCRFGSNAKECRVFENLTFKNSTIKNSVFAAQFYTLDLSQSTLTQVYFKECKIKNLLVESLECVECLFRQSSAVFDGNTRYSFGLMREMRKRGVKMSYSAAEVDMTLPAGHDDNAHYLPQHVETKVDRTVALLPAIEQHSRRLLASYGMFAPQEYHPATPIMPETNEPVATMKLALVAALPALATFALIGTAVLLYQLYNTLSSSYERNERRHNP